MDGQIQTETQQVPDLTWLRAFGGSEPLPATMSTAHLVEATHFPDGYVKSGTCVALFTGGAQDTLWTPWVEDGANGEDALAAIVYTGFQVRKTAAGAVVSTRTVGSIIIAGQGAVIDASKLPVLLLTDDSTPNVVSNANLTTGGFIPLNLGV